jgi:hypothetical protein
MNAFFSAHYFFLERVSATKRPQISRSPREQEREGNGITLRGSKWPYSSSGPGSRIFDLDTPIELVLAFAYVSQSKEKRGQGYPPGALIHISDQ